MDFEGPLFVIVLVAVCTAGWVINNWIRAKHGYPLENEWGGTTPHPAVPAERQITLLSNENAELKSKLVRMEERVAVLERIATDSGTRIAHEIERLRD